MTAVRLEYSVIIDPKERYLNCDITINTAINNCCIYLLTFIFYYSITHLDGIVLETGLNPQ